MDWFSGFQGHLFSNFPFLPNGVSHFSLLQFSHPSGSVGLPHFPARFRLSVKFLKFGRSCVGSRSCDGSGAGRERYSPA